MKTAAYTACSGLQDQVDISSRTLSVILETVSLEMLAAYTSWKSALICPVLRPLANRLIATASTSERRRWRFLTMTGSNVPALSLGTAILTSPAASVSTVLGRVPLRMFPPSPVG